MTRISVYAFTRQGAELGRRLASGLDAQLFVSERFAGDGETGFASVRELVAGTFSAFDAHVFIGAAGIAVRAIAPHLTDKASDPAVVVLDQKGEYVVPILSGHLGGANELARAIAGLTDGTAVITTATDTEKIPAIDLLAKEAGLVIDNLSAVKHVSAALLEGKSPALFDPENRLGLDNRQMVYFEIIDAPGELANHPVAVRVGHEDTPAPEGHLILRPRDLVCGIGCRRGTAAEEIIGLVEETFKARGLSTKSIRAVASIDAKSDEQGLLEAARHFGAQAHFFSTQELDEIPVPTPSERVQRYMGVASVCEAAAMKLAKTNSLLVPKTKSAAATLAVAQAH